MRFADGPSKIPKIRNVEYVPGFPDLSYYILILKVHQYSQQYFFARRLQFDIDYESLA